jgi:DNA adenine methylase
MPQHFNRLLEPFAGMAAITVAVANERHANKYIISDINEPIVRLLQTVIDNPYELTQKYSSLWAEQFEYNDEHFEHFYHVGDDFNSGNKSPENIL